MSGQKGQRIGYARVSSEYQALDRQMDVLGELNLDRIFTDKLSGKDTERIGLKEMLLFVREGDHIFVHSMDRLARNLVDLRNMIKDLTSKKIQITFVKENLTFIGDDSPMSILLLNIMGSVAEFERAWTKERQAEGIKLAKAKGIYKGRVASLTPEQVIELRIKVDSGIPKAKVAKVYGVCRETLYRYLSQGKENLEGSKQEPKI